MSVQPRVALVHDWLNQAGGAEHVLGVLHGMFPSAPIYTTIQDVARVPDSKPWDVRTSWMDRLPGIHARHQPYLPLYPIAWDTSPLPPDAYDLVISNKSGFCHGVRAGRAVHVCYCLTPTRFVWQPGQYLAHERVPAGGRLALRLLLPWLRRWDRRAADRVDDFIAISSAVRERIHAVYQRDAIVIHPPADVGPFRSAAAAAAATGGGPGSGDGEASPYHIVAARLVPYKRIDLAVEAFTRMGRRLVVVGDGRDRARLERMAGPNIDFRGRVPRAELARLLAGAQALVWPGEEDFGLAPVEAMAAGRPVVALRAGGVVDTVVDGITGTYFDEPSADALEAAVRRADGIGWDRAQLQARADDFGPDVFERRLSDFLSHLDVRRSPHRDRRPAARAEA